MTSRHFFVVVHPSIHPPCGFLQESSRADDGDFYLFEVSANRRLYIVCRDRKIGADGRGKTCQSVACRKYRKRNLQQLQQVLH